MKAVLMPALGVAMSEGLLVRWLKSTGDTVTAGEPVMEIETDKSTIEIPSPATGVLGTLLFEPGALIPVGVAMTHIVEVGDPRYYIAGVHDPKAGSLRDVPASVGDQPAAPFDGTTVQLNERTPHRLSPRQRRLAEDREQSPEQQWEPAAAAVAVPAETAGAPTGGRHREVIATRVSESWRTIPHFAVTREASAAAMMAVREHHKDERPSFTVLMIKALAFALRERGEPGGVDVGLAVATPDGVVIPVIRRVLSLAFSELLRETAAAISSARNGRLRPADVSQPPRSTLSNLGPLGIDSFTGIIAFGQVSLLTVGQIRPRPNVVDGTLSVRDSFVATLNVDHRVLDGDGAAHLLAAFVAAVEDADRLARDVVPK